jgi:hypothetical protein
MVVFKGKSEDNIIIHRVQCLTPDLLIVSLFAGAPKGRIALREPPSLPKDLVYACQKKAWFDKAVMNQ